MCSFGVSRSQPYMNWKKWKGRRDGEQGPGLSVWLVGWKSNNVEFKRVFV